MNPLRMKEVYVLAGTRTPFSRMGSDLAQLSASDLGREVTTALLNQSGIDPHGIDEVIMGCVCQPADAANVARVIALRSGIPEHIPAVTVHRNCASGFEAITTAYERIQANRGELYLVGGAESMSNAPLLYNSGAVKKYGLLAKAKSLSARLKVLSSFRPKDFAPIIGLQVGLTDPVSGLNMGQTAEVLAREYDLSRTDLDTFAAESQGKALQNTEARAREISSIYTNGKAVNSDNGVREDSSVDRLARLRPVFDRKTGVVTAGNSSQITDGAVALLVGTSEAAQKHNLTPLGRLVDYAHVGCDPVRMGLGPVKAIEAVNHRAQLSLDDADLIEINEAFAAQVLACTKALADPEYAQKAGLSAPLGAIDPMKLNRLGGSIALGHPVGATGARLVLSALHQLQDTNQKRALVSACVGGGQGTALWLES